MNSEQFLKDFLRDNEVYQEYLKTGIENNDYNVEICKNIDANIKDNIQEKFNLSNINAVLVNSLNEMLGMTDIDAIKEKIQDTLVIVQNKTNKNNDLVDNVQVVWKNGHSLSGKRYSSLTAAKIFISYHVAHNLTYNKIADIFEIEFVITYKSGLIKRESLKEFAIKKNNSLIKKYEHLVFMHPQDENYKRKLEVFQRNAEELKNY